ncbi:aminotransferase class I/II-fold pyridoxal phosphate-dependent enzyme [Streptomyces sp. NPDC091212]|uniref:aminotransferase class I/II-fold pyridoxal phosphate-dependent enzyme n=1 Tax=Streptomyces sp. NPDC091212 TaxID=3155191 RepID=UPI0034446365
MNIFVQDAALVAVRSCEEDVARMRSAYEVRRESTRTELAAIPGLTLSSPEGAFYQFPGYDIDLPSVEVVAALRTHGVAVRPGSEFGARGRSTFDCRTLRARNPSPRASAGWPRASRPCGERRLARDGESTHAQ